MNIRNWTKQTYTRIRSWTRRHPRRTAAIAIGLILLIGAGIYTVSSLINQPEPQATPTKPAKKPTPPPVYYSPLTGVKVADEAATKQPVTAIMIENSPDARPHSGLKEAGIVYEAVAEGGITRFLAVYQETKPGLIGPVRSLRMYFLDWAAPYDACIAHIGGSAAALAEVRNGSYCDTDQFFNAGSYWRASDRYAPHNVYTNFQKMDEVNAAKGKTTSSFKGFSRTDGKASAQPNATALQLNFSSALYNTQYAYDAATNTYHRSLAGAPHLDREAGQITPTVVVALRVDMTKIFEDGWREHIETNGSGTAVLFQNGTATDITWRKNSRKEPLELLDANGAPVKLSRGQTWIAAIPNQGGSISWQ